MNALKKKKCESRIHFAGHRPDPAAVLNALDVLVHCSIRPEPFGRILIEAMACGIPVVASAAGGVLEIVTHEKNGLLYAPAHIDQMSEQCQRLLRDPALRQRLIVGGEQYFQEKGTLDRVVEKVAAFYRRQISA